MTQQSTFLTTSILFPRGTALVQACGLVATLLLGACGGGDSGSDEDPDADSNGVGGAPASFGTGGASDTSTGSSATGGGTGVVGSTGGATGVVANTGGTNSSGGVGNTSGGNGTGAVGSTGGSTSGVDNTGGMNSSGGRSSTGGAGTGGVQNTGGRSSTGGVGSGGAQNTGGRSSTGGAGTGGMQNTGGSDGTAGFESTGGMENTGGNDSTGGFENTGGLDSTGGVENTGGNDGTGGTGGGTGGEASCSGGSLRTGFYVENGKLYDDHCNQFILRGVNYPYAWYADQAESRFGDMSSVGCNVVRVVLATGAQWARTSGSTVSSIISWAKANKMVAVLEVHDSTGWGDSSAAVHPDDAVAYWTSQDILSAIKDQEPWVIINIANEAFGNDTSDQWASFYQGAVVTLRNAGIGHTLMVDAPNWGQDWANTMRDGDGPVQIFEADPDRNVVFSVHMYDVYGTSDAVWTYYANFLEKGLPLVVGEFAADHGSAGNVDEDEIMAAAEDYSVGYMGWSWSGNSSDLVSLDITNSFNVNSLSTWGDRLINGTNGIKATAKVCTCYDD